MRGTRIVCFSHGSMNSGGVETWILRAAQQLSEMGETAVIAAREGHLVENLDSDIHYYNVSSRYELLQAIRQIHRTLSPESVTVHFFKPIKYYDGIWLQSKFPKDFIKFSVGVVHPRAGFRDTDAKRTQKFSKHALLSAPRTAIWYMSETVRSAHEKSFGAALSDYPIQRLTVSRNRVWTPSQSGKLKICSIGRFVPFKAYNFSAASIVKQLQEQGVDCSWDLWGDGPDLKSVSQEIQYEQMQEYVRLPGTLAYGELESTLQGYDLFVGMGTAALEAAACGVPTILAMDFEKTQCAGYLFESPNDSIGENHESISPVIMRDKIIEYYYLNREERMRISNLCIDSVQRKTSAFNPEDWKSGASTRDFGPIEHIFAIIMAYFIVTLDRGATIKKKLRRMTRRMRT